MKRAGRTAGLAKLARVGAVVVVSAIITVAGRSSAAAAAPVQTPRLKTSEVRTHMSRGDVKVVQGATARAVVSGAGVTVNVFTRELVPGNVYTMWWVVVNKPSACASTPCSSQDVLTRTDTVEADVGYADGAIADANGVASFFAHLAPGPVPRAWYKRGLKDPFNAEVHVILHDHGPVIQALKESMLRTLRGGCRDDSVPAAFPASAKADGMPGPNRCQLYQFAIFEPSSSGN